MFLIRIIFDWNSWWNWIFDECNIIICRIVKPIHTNHPKHLVLIHVSQISARHTMLSYLIQQSFIRTKPFQFIEHGTQAVPQVVSRDKHSLVFEAFIDLKNFTFYSDFLMFHGLNKESFARWYMLHIYCLFVSMFVSWVGWGDVCRRKEKIQSESWYNCLYIHQHTNIIVLIVLCWKYQMQ